MGWRNTYSNCSGNSRLRAKMAFGRKPVNKGKYHLTAAKGAAGQVERSPQAFDANQQIASTSGLYVHFSYLLSKELCCWTYTHTSYVVQ